MANRKLTRQNFAHFLEYVAEVCPQVTETKNDTLIPRQLVMPYSFERNNIIPAVIDSECRRTLDAIGTQKPSKKVFYSWRKLQAVGKMMAEKESEVTKTKTEKKAVKETAKKAKNEVREALKLQKKAEKMVALEAKNAEKAKISEEKAARKAERLAKKEAKKAQTEKAEQTSAEAALERIRARAAKKAQETVVDTDSDFLTDDEIDAACAQFIVSC